MSSAVEILGAAGSAAPCKVASAAGPAAGTTAAARTRTDAGEGEQAQFDSALTALVTDEDTEDSPVSEEEGRKSSEEQPETAPSAWWPAMVATSHVADVPTPPTPDA